MCVSALLLSLYSIFPVLVLSIWVDSTQNGQWCFGLIDLPADGGQVKSWILSNPKCIFMNEPLSIR